MGDFLACVLGVINRHLGTLVGGLGDILAGVISRVIGQVESLLRTLPVLDDQFLSAAITSLTVPFAAFKPSLPTLSISTAVSSVPCFCVVGNDLRSFLQSAPRAFSSRANGFCAVDGGLGHKVERMLNAIRRFDHDNL